MSDPLPPLGPEQGWDARACQRDIGIGPFDLEGEQLCGKPGAWHVIWDPTGENSVACDRHAAEALDPWHAVQVHPLKPDCTMPGSAWVEEERRCIWEGDEVPVSAVAAQRVVAGPR